MAKKPTYEELEKRVSKLEKESFEQKRTEKKLMHQKRHLEALIEYSSLAIVTLDEGHNIISCNRDFEKLFHFKGSEIVGRNLDELITDQKYIEDAISYTKKTLKGKAIRGSGKRQRKDGTYIDVQFIGVPVIIGGKVIGAYGVYQDISERKQAEEELRKTRERLELAMDAGEHGFWDWNLDTDDVYFSPRYYTMLGYEPGELPMKLETWVNLMHPDDQKTIVPEVENYVKNAQPYGVEFRLKTKDGNWKWISGRGKSYEKDKDGVPHRAVGVHVDITERKRAEEKLNIQRARIKSLFDYSSEAMVLFDLGNHIIDINLAFEDMFGYSVKETHGKVMEDLICPERFYHTESKELDEQSLNGIKGAEIIRMRKDGKEINVRVSAGPIKVNNIITGRFAIFDDITERKQAEETLRFERNKVLNILDSMEDGIYIVNQQYDIQYVNPIIIKDFGPYEGQKCYEYLHDRDEFCPWCKNQDVWAGKTVRWEWHSSKNQKTYDLIDTPLKNLDGSISKLEIFRDITERKQAEEEKEKLQDKLQQAKKMETIGILAGGVAHDLNNILSGIISYPELLLMDLPQDSPLRKPLLTIKSSGEKAAVIVQDLLTMARKGVTITEIVNLNSIISEQLKSPEYENLKSFHPNVDIEANLEKDLLNIKGSTAHLGKTVMNLISNAAEAMPDGGKVLISTENLYIDRPIKGYDQVDEGDYVTVTVIDTGIGISKEDIERIFEPFYTKKIMGRSGSGLGMSVVWGTVKDHNGYIDVESTKGKGTTFILYFPITREEVATDKSLLSIEDYMGKGESILIVDDVEEQREIASVMLNKLGYSVMSVSSGEEAIEYMKDNPVDLLVLDMIMDPGIDGLDTYKKILKLHPKQKAIIASGFSETDRVKKAKKLGAGAYVKKPYVLEKIGVVIKEELEK